MEDELTKSSDDTTVDVGTDQSTDTDDDGLEDTLDTFEREALVKFVATLVAIIGLNTAIQAVPVTPIAALLIGLLGGLSGKFDGYVSSLIGAGVGAAVAVLLTSFVGVLVTLGGSAVFWGIVGAVTAGAGTFLGNKIRERLRG